MILEYEQKECGGLIGSSSPAHPALREDPFMRLIAVACCVVWAAAAAVARADQLADIRHKGELTCGVLATDEPMSFVDPQTRTIIGYEVDLCRAVARKVGVTATVKQIAVGARIPELQQGHVDVLAATLTHTRQREAVIDFSLTTFLTGQKVMVRRDSGISSLPQLAGKKVVTVKGGTQEANLRKVVPSVDVVTFETAPQALVALQQHKAAGFVNDEVSLFDAYAKLGPAQKDYVILPQSVSTEPIAMGLRKNEPGMKAAVDAALRELESSGEAQKLFFKWFGPGTRLQYSTRPFKIESDRVAG
jgi:polar amino acid transport system substrate-binding protein